MSRLVVAVKSCLRDLDRGYHDVIRNTWGADAKAAGVLVRFFVGAETDGKTSRIFKSDEVQLDCADGYMALPHKTRAICNWVRTKLVDHVFLCDTDTYIHVKKLKLSGYQQYDYMGVIRKEIGVRFDYQDIDRDGNTHIWSQAYPWASGGYGYFLSKNACEDVSKEYPLKMWAEDFWVGQVMGELYDRGYAFIGNSEPNFYSWHFPQNQYNSGYDLKFGWMDEMHRKQR